MATTEELRIAEIPDVEVDAVTLDIIEGALKSARFEMDAVLFRSAMSPVIREQHDEFPMITDPRGRMVVGQFGAYINEMMAEWEGGIYPGDVILTSDPFKCSASISHTNDWLVLVPIFFEDELVGWSSQFGHQMDAGGPLPGSLPTGAKTIFEEGIIIPPLKIVERGVPQDAVLKLIFNNVRLPEMNRADLFAIVAGCRAGERRVIELCERFGKETYLAALQALLDRTLRGDAAADPARDPGGAAELRGLRRRRRSRQRPLQDEADDLARGRPGVLRLVGHRPAGARADQLLPLRGHVQDVHRDLPDHGQRSPDPLQRRLLSPAARRHAGRIAAAAALPGRARLPDARARAALRRPRRRAREAGAGAEHGRRLRHEPVHALFRLGREGRLLLLDGDPLRRHPRPADRRRDGRPLVVAAVREHPDGVPRGVLPAADRRLHDGDRLRWRRLPSWRERRREALRLPRAGRGVDPRRPLADAALGRARRRARRALGEDPAPGRRDRGAAAVEVRPRRRRAGRHARLPHRGRRRLEGPARPSRRDRRPRRLVRARVAEHARAGYGVVLAEDGTVDVDATEAERSRQRDERGEALAFDFGPPLDEVLAACKDETGLEPPAPAKPLRWSPLEDGAAALARVRVGDGIAEP